MQRIVCFKEGGFASLVLILKRHVHKIAYSCAKLTKTGLFVKKVAVSDVKVGLFV